MGRLRPGGRTVQHPARYSPEVTTLFRLLVGSGARVHDPFAGTGERLLQVALTRDWHLTGTEIEGAFIVEPWVTQGDATDPSTYPPRWLCTECGGSGGIEGRHKITVADGVMRWCGGHPRGFVIMTSPVYPNGIADSFHAQDGSRRRTYRTALAETTGVDAELDENNMGRWGYRSNALGVARQMYWHLAARAVVHWSTAEAVLVNVSDFVAGARILPVVVEWQRLLERNGWCDIEVHQVPTHRWRDGANRDARVETEIVLHAYRRRAGDTGQSPA